MDQGLMARVLANLVENACKYSATGKAITIGVEPDGGVGVFTVRLPLAE